MNIINALEGSFQLMLSGNPEGLRAYLVTTFMIFVMMPGIIGMVLGMVDKTIAKSLAPMKLVKWWLKYPVLGPPALLVRGIIEVAKAIRKSMRPGNQQQQLNRGDRQQQNP